MRPRSLAVTTSAIFSILTMTGAAQPSHSTSNSFCSWVGSPPISLKILPIFMLRPSRGCLPIGQITIHFDQSWRVPSSKFNLFKSIFPKIRPICVPSNRNKKIILRHHIFEAFLHRRLRRVSDQLFTKCLAFRLVIRSFGDVGSALFRAANWDALSVFAQQPNKNLIKNRTLKLRNKIR
jgi:hypothetical protein